jgi:hypothetical protein
MIARLTPYRTRSDALEPLIEEIGALARSSMPLNETNRRAEFFLINRSSGDGLSVVIGHDRTVTPVIELSRAPDGEPEEYDVHLLQVGGPRDSGVVDALLGRLVRCDGAALTELSFDGDAVPTSPEVWARALLVAPDRDHVLALAVATDRAALEESLRKFSARCPRVDDYDDVAYHFFVDDPGYDQCRGESPPLS